MKKTYTPKPIQIQAEQFTDSNQLPEGVSKREREMLDGSKVAVYLLETPEGPFMVEIGDYILGSSLYPGRKFVIKKAAFERQYQEYKGE